MFGQNPFVTPPQIEGELTRILNLPTREWTTQDVDQFVQALTTMLRKPGGTQTLWPVQAVALFEIAQVMGGFIPVRVSGGKTLISLLSPTVTAAKRPLLLVPAKLREKTRRDWIRYSAHWKIPEFIKIESYERFTRLASKDELTRFQPDLIILDEAHKAKDRGRSVAKRITRYLHDHPSTRVVAMTGTIAKRSITDYAHIATWALGPLRVPIPVRWEVTQTWANVLDEQSGSWARDADPPDPGALVALCKPGETPRQAYQRRLRSTLGVVTTITPPVDIPIVIDRADTPERPEAVQTLLKHLRDTWTTPNGLDFQDAPAMWRHARAAALGFVDEWDPLPPVRWRAVRKLWFKAVRAILQGDHTLDTELDVVNAVDRGRIPEVEGLLAEWREVEPTFKPTSKPVWVDSTMVEWTADYLRANKGTLCWTSHTAFARALEKASGAPYYAGQAKTRQGHFIMDHDPRDSAIVSLHAVREGFNLQAFSRALYVPFCTNGEQAEQSIGRIHRELQTADEIQITIAATCDEHERAIVQCYHDALFNRDTHGEDQQKLLLADWTFDLDELRQRHRRKREDFRPPTT